MNINMSLITCPNCQAQYQIGADALGKEGRMVKCARCQNDWRAFALPAESAIPDDAKEEKDSDQPSEEALLDAGFEQIEKQHTEPANKTGKAKVVAGPGLDEQPELDPAQLIKKRKEMAERQMLLNRHMPKARFRRAVRIVEAVVLAAILVGGIGFRENIVRAFPDMSGFYQAIGLGVNVFGLEFSDVKTLVSLQEGEEVMEISASIVSVSSGQVSVPPIVVTLLDEAGQSLYEWSVSPRASIMLPGEVVGLQTQLTSPPPQTKTVRLTFEGTKAER